MSDLYPDFDKIKAIDMLDHLHVSPIKIAEWVVDEKIKIVGFIDPDKINPKIKTAAELDEIRFIEVKRMYIREVQLALWAWRDEMGQAGGTDLEKTDHLEQQLSDGLRFLVFDRDSLESLINEATPPNIMPAGDTDEIAPEDPDGKSSARKEILSYAGTQIKNGSPLSTADFTEPTDKTILAICEKYNVSPASLRKYVSDAKYLKHSKTGKKSASR